MKDGLIRIIERQVPIENDTGNFFNHLVNCREILFIDMFNQYVAYAAVLISPDKVNIPDIIS